MGVSDIGQMKKQTFLMVEVYAYSGQILACYGNMKIVHHNRGGKLYTSDNEYSLRNVSDCH